MAITVSPILVPSHANLASDYTRNAYASSIQRNEKGLFAKLEEAKLKEKQDAITALSFASSKWSQWGVSRILFLDQAVEQGLAQLPSTLLSLILRTAYAGIAGLGFYRSAEQGSPDIPRERMWTSLDNFKTALSNLALGVTGAVWPLAAIWLEDKLKFKAEKA